MSVDGPRRPASARVAGALGWACVTAGAIVLLYLVYSLFFTNFQTAAAQRELLSEFTAEVAAAPAAPAVDRRRGQARPQEPAPPPAGGSAEATPAASSPPDPGRSASAAPELAGAEAEAVPLGSAIAAMEFVRPGSTQASPVHEDPLLVVEGVTREALTRGPGRYPGTALPGQPGNFAVAGHRTTYGAPFFHLDQLAAGDEIHVADRSGAVHVYRFAEQRIVSPGDVGVLSDDPRGTGVPTLTLTTCHPRFSAAQRMVVFAELVS